MRKIINLVSRKGLVGKFVKTLLENERNPEDSIDQNMINEKQF